MQLACPRCASTRWRVARLHHFGEHLLALLGRYPLRCRTCDHRFVAGYRLRDLLPYAHCPKCYRSDLSAWVRQHYRVSLWTSLKLWLGAKALRCESCRCNFASFRFVRERYQERQAGLVTQ